LRQRFFARFLAAQDAENHARYGPRKEALFQGLTGNLLEIGPGTGVNFQYLGAGVQWAGIEPNPAMHPHLRREVAQAGREVTLYPALSGDGGVASESQDVVLSTLVLCSVADLDAMLGGIKRVLKPGGRFVFLEHVADRPGTLRRTVQKTVPFTPWRYFSDGCNPGRDIAGAIRAAGFGRVDCQAYMLDAPGIIAAITRPHIFGTAQKD